MTEHLDFLSHIRDEIALEGLDGITIEALWKRLNNRPNFKENLAIDDHNKNFMWSLLVEDEELLFYKLNEPRKNLFIFNRYEYVDKEVGMILESENEFEDIYPCVPLQDSNLGIRGSCSSYKTREDVTNQVTNLSLLNIEKQYGNSLVIVASQLLRNKSLGLNSAIDKFHDLTLIQYVMLERVGRSRTLGEITYGKNSLACMNTNAKSMFYIRKRLLKLNLITKQNHQQKTCRGPISSSSLLQLSRFFVLRRTKFVVLIQKVVEILKNKPGHLHPLASVKIQIGMGDVSTRKFFNNSEFLKYIRTITVPYRQVYQGAAESEWKLKVRDGEKTIRCLQLIDPDLELEKVGAPKDEEPSSDADEEDIGILDQSELVLGESLMYQAYRAVENAGPDGLSQIELAKKLGQTKLDARTICRNLHKRNVIYSLMKDFGRQRVSRYVSNKYSSTGHLLQELEVEKQKMREIVESTSVNKSDSEDIQISYQSLSTSRVMESDPVDNIDISLEISFNGVTTCATVHEECFSDTAKGKESRRLVVKPVSETKDLSSSLKKNQQTARVLKRRNIIIGEIKKKMVMDDTFYLQNFIIEQENKEGLDGKMDRKSFNRLLLKITRDGFIKMVVVKMRSAIKDLKVTMLVHSTIGIDNQLLLDALERHKHKFLVHVSKHNPSVLKPTVKTEAPSEDSEFKSPQSLAASPPSVGASVLELKQMLTVPDGTKLLGKSNTTPEMTLVGMKRKVAKFFRLREFHKLLVYLVYGFEGNENLDQEEAWFSIINSSLENLSSECTDEYPSLYVPELSWKMFISPLPTHQSEGDTDSTSGWCFMADILLRIPLCIFANLVNVNFKYSLLDEYLRHPIKKNLLVKNLPPELKKVILHNRRHVPYLMDLCHQLCYIGLGQYGKQILNLKEKDEVFFYVNKNAILVDTITSGPGYNQISTDKEYVKKYYKFDVVKDVISTYWFDMQTICINTRLGGRSCVQGKLIEKQDLAKKKEMIESIASRSTKEAQERDVGYIPGDGRGSGGLDSAMYSHLRRNWYRTTPCTISATTTSVTEHLDSASNKEDGSSEEKVFSYPDYLKNSCQPNSPATKPPAHMRGFRNVRLYKSDNKNEGAEVNLKVPVGLVRFSKKKLKKKLEDEISASNERPPLKKKRKTRECYRREIKMRKKAPRKPYYDKKDREALSKMQRLRSGWLAAEDLVLLLCKIASDYLFPTNQSQIFSSRAVRDILHEKYPESRSKTSRACQRRINYMIKNSVNTKDNVKVLLQELKQDPEITKEFQPLTHLLNQASMNDEYGKLFKRLFDRLTIKFSKKSTTSCRTVPHLPSSTEEFEKSFHIITTSTSFNEHLNLGPINTVADIDRYVVHALLFSSLCTSQDKESWAFQLYLAYQKYPQSLLKSVLKTIQESKMISYKKRFSRSSYPKQCLPLSMSPFKLSNTFTYTFHMKYQYEIISECCDFTKNLLNQKKNYFWDIESSRTDDPLEKTQKKKRCNKRKRKETSNISIEKFPVTTEGKSHKNETLEVPSVENEKLSLSDEQRIEDIAEEGVQVIINQEGGFCAAIVALMASQRLSFEVVIPDQIRRHVRISGRKFVLPEEFSFQANEGEENYVLPNVDDCIEDEEVSDFDTNDSGCKRRTSSNVQRPSLDKLCSSLKENSFVLSVENETNHPSTSEPSTSLAAEENSSSIPEENGSSLESYFSNDGLKPSTSETETARPNEIDQTKLSDDNYALETDDVVIHACQINCRLTDSVINGEPTSLNLQSLLDDVSLIKHFLPVCQHKLNVALQNRKKVILSDWIQWEDAVRIWRDEEHRPSSYIEMAQTIYDMIDSCKELGASTTQIKENFEGSNCLHHPMELVRNMENINLLLKVGVETFRWVTIHNSKPWLIRTNKLSRNEMKTMESNRKGGVYELSEEASVEKKSLEETCVVNQPTKRTHDDTLEESTQSVRTSKRLRLLEGGKADEESQKIGCLQVEERASEGINTTGLHVRSKLALKYPMLRKETKSMSDVQKNMDGHASKTEEIAVTIRPWVRLNGSLNRRVLDRFLGAILLFVMERPGITALLISQKFWPAIQPAHTYELLDTLKEIDCVKRYRTKQSVKCSLFSKRQESILDSVEDYDFDEGYFYEATVDSLLKLSMFIGDRKYNQDFLAHCSHR